MSTSATSCSSSTATLLSAQSSITLDYTIADVSSYSASYAPENIRLDRPNDLASRWSGASVAAAPPSSSSSAASGAVTSSTGHGSGGRNGNGSGTGSGSSPIGAAGGGTSSTSGTSGRSLASLGLGPTTGPASGKQYVVLKLEDAAVVKSIYFGKFNKPHPCNLKDFKVYGGPSPDPHSGLWTRLLRAGLRNDAVPEEFALKWTDASGTPLPLRYIKVVPLAAHSPNYNFSVWYVSLKGVSDKTLIGRARQEYDEQCESNTIRLILKHLRARGHHSAFQALLSSSKLDATSDPSTRSNAATRLSKRPFEHPLVTQLYQAIMRGDWDAAETCLDTAAGLTRTDSDEGASSNGLFAAFVSTCSQQAEWTRLLGTDVDGGVPCARGGHQLVLDTVKGTAYLFGGWDGKADLNDLWIYYMQESRWRCISKDTTLQGGPSPRSCHRMAFDSRSGIIYVLGRYVDYETQQRHKDNRQADSPSRGATAPSAEGGAWVPPTTGATGARLGRDQAPSSGSSGRTTPLGGSDAVAGSARASTLSPNLAATAAARGSPRSPKSTTGPHTSDFFRFSTRSERWDRLSSDTALDGGPKLIFDHQMVVDEESQVMYVFGGRVVHWDPAQLQLSGMWSYDCIQRTWTFLFDDDTRTGGKILSRAGHSMLLDVGASSGDSKRQLWILAGQRADTYLADMYTYNLSNGQVRQISRDYSQGGAGPEGGFTQRATIDSAKREIHLYNGIVRRTGRPTEVGGAKSALWVYNMDRDEWKQVWEGGAASGVPAEDEEDEEEDSPAGGADEVSVQSEGRADKSMATTAATRQVKKARTREPQPRYASQLVFDARSSHFLLFGGNPAEAQSSPSQQQQQQGGGGGRLDDLWSLRLLRPEVSEVLRRAKFALRQQRFREMAAAIVIPKQGLFASSLLAPPSSAGSASTEADGGWKALEALAYLQTEVAAVVDHDAPEEARTFRRLVAGLLDAEAPGREGDDQPSDDGATDTAGRLDLGAQRRGRDASAGEEDDRKEDGKEDAESDGLPAVDEDADMLSVSQTLPPSTELGSCKSLGPSGGATSRRAARGPSSTATSSATTGLAAMLGGVGADLTSLPALEASQHPPPLWRQRLGLFRQLLHWLPTEHVEPIQEDLATCVAAWAVRRGGGGGGGGGGGEGRWF